MPMTKIIDFSMRLLSISPMMQIIDVPGASTRKGGKQMSMEQPDRSYTQDEDAASGTQATEY